MDIDTDLDAHLRRTTPPHAPRPWPLPIVESPRIRELTAALEAADAAARDTLVEEFLAELEAGGAPLIEPADGPDHRVVTFAYFGPAPHVYLVANKLTDVFAPAEGRMHRVVNSDLATISVRMPADWLCSYHFLTPDSPFEEAEGRLTMREVLGQAGVLTSDPRNPNQRPNKLVPHAPHSIVALERAPREPETAPYADWRQEQRLLTLPVSGERVTVTVRSHPNASAASPAVLLLDGEVWLDDDLLVGALAARIASGDCPPVHLVYLPSAGPRSRQLDYPADARKQGELLARIRRVLEAVVPGHDGGLVPAGQSLGGLFSMLAAVRFPELVRAAVGQSPSLWWPTLEPPHQSPGAWFAELGAARDTAPCAVQVGHTEWLLQGAVLHAREFLRALDRLVETPGDAVTGGHDVAWWRRTLPDAICAVLARSTR
ncbi:enterochelin esterase domain-containing protein [Gulosibacter faecalis]|uniref:Enterochelin esterase domain-containing protein n=1 Tax=Gulosibacter faecalis TaxID=272240 RepID=A0ABW5UXR0_9MICO|nr:alpha/beta hydrolase-fold protein [Gulosibacter faecalis]